MDLELELEERERDELTWEDLTPEEQDRAKEQYIAIREAEEERSRFETTDAYPEPINEDLVTECRFYRDEHGDIVVLI